MDLVALKSELTVDPLGRGYASMSDGAAADRINVSDRTGNVAITPQELHAYFLFNGLWQGVVNLSNNTTNASQQAAAIALIEICHWWQTIDLGNPTVWNGMGSLLTLLRQATVISSAQQSAIVALANKPRSRAEELGLGPVSHLDVAAARRLP